jgi:hypothetical protein
MALSGAKITWNWGLMVGRIENGVNGSGFGLIPNLSKSLRICLESWGILRKISAWIVGVRNETWTRDLPNTKQNNLRLEHDPRSTRISSVVSVWG